MIRRGSIVFGIVILGILGLRVCWHRAPKEHSAEAARKLVAMIDSITPAIAEGLPVKPAPQPDKPQECFGTFNNDQGTRRITYAREITIPPNFDPEAFVERVSTYLKAHGYRD